MQGGVSRQNVRTKGKGNEYLFPLFICIAGGEIVSLLVTLLGALAVSQVDSQMLTTIFAFLAVGLGSIVTGFLTGMAFRKERFFMGLVSGLCLCLILVVANLLFFREPVTKLTFVKYGLILILTLGCALLIKPAKKRRSQR